jgi:hypothetical protein
MWYDHIVCVVTPLLEECEDDTHTPKMGTWESSGIPEASESIAGVKTPRIWVFFILLESYRSLDVENGFAWTIWTFAEQVMAKERPRVKLAIWLPTTKSWESTQPQCVQVECDTPLEVCFRPHPNRRFEQGIMISQNPESPNRNSFGTPPWESRDYKSFGCRCHGEMQRIIYGGRWWLPSNPGRGESCESRVTHGLS